MITQIKWYGNQEQSRHMAIILNSHRVRLHGFYCEATMRGILHCATTANCAPLVALFDVTRKSVVTRSHSSDTRPTGREFFTTIIKVPMGTSLSKLTDVRSLAHKHMRPTQSLFLTNSLKRINLFLIGKLVFRKKNRPICDIADNLQLAIAVINT